MRRQKRFGILPEAFPTKIGPVVGVSWLINRAKRSMYDSTNDASEVTLRCQGTQVALVRAQKSETWLSDTLGLNSPRALQFETYSYALPSHALGAARGGGGGG